MDIKDFVMQKRGYRNRLLSFGLSQETAFIMANTDYRLRRSDKCIERNAKLIARQIADDIHDIRCEMGLWPRQESVA